MSSLARQTSSRANGSLSRGPKTKEGKSRSSINALTHGLTAKTASLKRQNCKAFQELLHQYNQSIAPRDAVEQAAVDEICAAAWRLHSVWTIERNAVDLELTSQASAGDLDHLARSYRALVRKHPHFRILQRYEVRLQNIIKRSLASIQTLRQINEKKFERTTPAELASAETSAGSDGAHAPCAGALIHAPLDTHPGPADFSL
ncbi:MAG: hypothetical protein Q8N47_00655 [Bryobacterales bacterium]|nr:hypothetical protein [Bryobacterales bacterium]